MNHDTTLIFHRYKNKMLAGISKKGHRYLVKFGILEDCTARAKIVDWALSEECPITNVEAECLLDLIDTVYNSLEEPH